ncbi:MAG: hypothetical protein J6Q14_08210 [Oscillospiraceae bacterium]|nr:hypothetical protein [Oscillospiraceae bacterium]
MKIVYEKDATRYFDIHGQELHDGDTVLMNGREQKVYLTEDGCLGTDATNPAWVASGRAAPCEYGVYPFYRADEPKLLRRA